MFKGFLALICCLVVSACTSTRQTYTYQQPQPDFVAMALGQAAETAHSELAMLAKLRGQGLQSLLPAPDPELNKLITITWTGTAEGILKEICLKIGYKYINLGTPSPQPLIVVVHGLSRSAYSLIEDIAWQVQPQGLVKVDPIQRVISLTRMSSGR